MVETLTPDGANNPFYVSSLPGRTRRRQHPLYSHISQLFSEILAENGVAITQQITRELLERERVPQLLAGPLGGRVRGHVEVKNAARLVRPRDRPQ